MPSVEERLDLRHNGLNALRLTLATLVIVSHAFPVSGAGSDPKLGDIKLGTLAVGGFFTISGYLIARSRLHSSAGSYAWRRFLRIFPGYWFCLIFTAFVAAMLGGLVRGGWTAHNAADFVLSSADMFGGRPLDDRTLAGAPLTGAWNGSLWTLRYEVACYVGAGLLMGLTMLWRRRWLAVLAYLLATAVTLAVHLAGIATGPVAEATLLIPYFVAGTLLLRFADTVHLTGKGAAVAAALLAMACAAGMAEPLAPLPLAYLMIWMGAAAPARIARIGSRNDVSYGMYLYGFPVQQLLVLLGIQRLGVVVFALLSTVTTIPLAWLSWLAVERPSMMAKHLPRRWRRGRTLDGTAVEERPVPASASR